MFNTNVSPNYFYIFTDYCFYASMAMFINVFTNYYNNINHCYKGNMNRYIPINYNNLILCENNPDFKWNWIVYPEIIHPKNKKIFFRKLKKM